MKLQPFQKDKLADFLDRALLYSLYGLVLFIPVSISAIEILFIIALAIFIVKKALKPDFGFLKAPHHIFLLLFFAFTGLSIFNSGLYLQKSLDALLFKWLEWILIFVMAGDALSSPSRVRGSVNILLSVSILIVIDGLAQRFLGVEFLLGREMVWINQGFYGMTASFQHYNSLGTYLSFVLLLVLGALVFGRLKRSYKAGLVFLAALLGACLLLTFSRGSWLGFLAGLSVMLALSPHRRVIFMVAALSVVLLITLPIVKERAFFIFEEYGTSERLGLLEICWRMIRENPFLGKGVGTFMDYCSIYTSGEVVKHAHNCYLQIAAETGIFALGSFLVFLGTVLYRSIKSLKKNFDYLLLGLVSAISGFLVQSFLDVQLYSLQLAALFWFFLGVMACVGRINDTTGNDAWKK
ncbi:MAG: O-antigen ligase family protein [Candidatus Omnitrophota bacterium]|nr:O-antigen ligase family protein [Candidatus Omnitrophota bacterium]